MIRSVTAGRVPRCHDRVGRFLARVDMQMRRLLLSVEQHAATADLGTRPPAVRPTVGGHTNLVPSSRSPRCDWALGTNWAVPESEEVLL